MIHASPIVDFGRLDNVIIMFPQTRLVGKMNNAKL